MGIKEQAQCGDVDVILKYRKSVFYATSCPQYLNIPCLAIARNRGRKAAERVENWDKVQQHRKISGTEQRFDQCLLWHFLNVLQSTFYSGTLFW